MALWAAVPVWLVGIFNLILFVLGLFLILLILIQRGKGGGLAGAFGGAGGSSAFGSRAGDTFTRITITVAAVWVLLIMLMVKIVQPPLTDRAPVLESALPGDEDQAQPPMPPPRVGGCP